MGEKVPTIHLFQESSINIIHCLPQGAVSLYPFSCDLKHLKESCRSVNSYYYCKSPLEHKCPAFKKKQKCYTKFLLLLIAEESLAIRSLNIHKAEDKLKTKPNTVK